MDIVAIKRSGVGMLVQPGLIAICGTLRLLVRLRRQIRVVALAEDGKGAADFLHDASRGAQANGKTMAATYSVPGHWRLALQWLLKAISIREPRPLEPVARASEPLEFTRARLQPPRDIR
ncbi:hypothetical protein AS156_06595 [Bradyrhizobium macuxiense]|uniref:Uncharacterized protein n=1 Tax=Bradyrhizobium macuxiense TaxID=1755647 RepID=A0A109JTI9_9BRAD|nr:hypothetical protein AS156_06595 [Bradyrhizobium macuxiense]